MIVVDTNILAYTILGGDYSAATDRLAVHDPHWVAPLLWRLEFRNLLAISVRSRRMSIDQAKRAMAAAEDRMREREYGVLSDDCAAESGLTAYDSELSCWLASFRFLWSPPTGSLPAPFHNMSAC